MHLPTMGLGQQPRRLPQELPSTPFQGILPHNGMGAKWVTLAECHHRSFGEPAVWEAVRRSEMTAEWEL